MREPNPSRTCRPKIALGLLAGLFYADRSASIRLPWCNFAIARGSTRAERATRAIRSYLNNVFGHIIEIREGATDGDFAATEGTWEILLQCGNPEIPALGVTFSSATTENGWFGMPDNTAVDYENRLWVTTDGNSASAIGRPDGLWAVDTDGAARATSKLFYRVPVGAEVCGPRSHDVPSSPCSARPMAE